MDLYILRHAIAEERTATGEKRDSQRRLTPEGIKKMRQAARGMKALGLEFDLILSSPYLRAKQTAEIVADIFRAEKKLELTASLAAQGNPKQLIEELSAAAARRKRILIVGHEPYLSQLISLLLSGGTGLAIDFKKGGLCLLKAETLRYGRCATLEWLLTPRQMRKLD